MLRRCPPLRSRLSSCRCTPLPRKDKPLPRFPPEPFKGDCAPRTARTPPPRVTNRPGPCPWTPAPLTPSLDTRLLTLVAAPGEVLLSRPGGGFAPQICPAPPASPGRSRHPAHTATPCRTSCTSPRLCHAQNTSSEPRRPRTAS